MNKKVTWDELPQEIQERMLDCQVEQGNPKDEKVFKRCIRAGHNKKGFTWMLTKEDVFFWEAVLRHGNIDHFYTLYPKQPKFQPIAMKCTQEQWDELKPELEKLPYGAQLICREMEVSDDDIRYIPHYVLVKKEYPLVAHPYMAIMPNGSTCSFRYAREIDPQRQEKEAKINELEKQIAELQETVNKLKGE